MSERGPVASGLGGTGFTLTHLEILGKRMQFGPWASRHDETTQSYLRAVLELAHGPVRGFLQPRWEEGNLTFGLQEGFLVARKLKSLQE